VFSCYFFVSVHHLQFSLAA